MPKLYLVRHAEPAIKGVVLGQSDPPLSQAGLAASRGLSIASSVVYSSPLRRAIETAQAFATDIVVLPELAEISMGEWDGLSWIEIEQRSPELVQRKRADWTGVTPPGGEAWSAFSDRIGSALETIRAGPMPAAVVAHVAVNAELAHRIAGVDPLHFQQDYLEVLEYEL